jgi:hypothetical protein
MSNAKRRLEKLEQPVAQLHIWRSYPADRFVPDVFDRPLKEWELFKTANKPRLPFLLTVDPFQEAELRGGEFPKCSARKYEEFMQQNGKMESCYALCEAKRTK